MKIVYCNLSRRILHSILTNITYVTILRNFMFDVTVLEPLCDQPAISFLNEWAVGRGAAAVYENRSLALESQ